MTTSRGFLSVPVLIGIFALLFVGVSTYTYIHRQAASTSTITESSSTPVVAGTSVQNGSLAITAPASDAVLPSNKAATVTWSIPKAFLDSFPSDFDVNIFLSATKQGSTGVDAPIGDGWDARAGSATWDIPGYIRTGQLTPGTYSIQAYLQATPKDSKRLCAKTEGKDCSPSDADRAVILRTQNITAASGIFTIGSDANDQSKLSMPGMSEYIDADFGFSFWYPSTWGVRAEADGDDFLGNAVTKRWVISNSRGEEFAEIKGFTFTTYTFESDIAGCFDTYFYGDVGWQESKHNCGSPDSTISYNHLADTLGGLPVLQFQAASTIVKYIVPLSAGKPVRGVEVDDQVGPGTFRNTAALARTISPIDPSVATSFSTERQSGYIESEKADYLGN